MTAEQFIQKCAEQIEPLEKEVHLAWWGLATSGDTHFEQQYQEKVVAQRKVLSSTEDYQFLLKHQNESDPKINRQLLLLKNEFTENQIPFEMIEEMVKIQTEIEAIYTNFRPKVDQKSLSNNDLKDILHQSLDLEKRKKAWEASKSIGEEVHSKVLTLVKLRNEAAIKAGFKDYYSMRLSLQELNEKELFDLLEQLDKLTTPQWKDYKTKLDVALSDRYQIPQPELMPWHYQDPFFQEAPQQTLDFDRLYRGKDIVSISQSFYESIGLPVDDILQRSDLYEREKKNQHAFCTCIDRGQDVRILCNIRDSEYWMCTQLHELGHAVYDKYIDQTLPYFLRTYAHTSTTEAIAMLFGRLSKEQDFLQQYCDVEEGALADIAIQSRRQSAANLLVFARWTLVMIHFEKALYEEPTQDLNALWWDYVEKFQWVKRVPSRNKPDWASKLHLACAPVYYQNYILGEMTASQLSHSLKHSIKGESICSSLKVGSWLKKHLFQLGAQFSWNETLKRATGEKLNPHYFTQEISTH